MMNSGFLEELKKLVPEHLIQSGPAKESCYDHIWRMAKGSKAFACVTPTSTRQIQDIMKLCNRLEQNVVVHGGRTNLVGSTVTNEDDLILSMEKMNAIREVDPVSRTMTVQAGVILENIQNAAKDQNLLFPLNFGAKGSAQIGGIIATNAGGLRVLKYGMTRQQVLGLKVVAPDGTLIDSRKKIIKDNSAYDLKQLYIGSEGTLGIITEAVLKLTEAPSTRISAFLGIDRYSQVSSLLKFLDQRFFGGLSGFELMWPHTYITTTSPPALARPPIGHRYKYYVLIEYSGSDTANDQDLFLSVLEEALQKQLYEDAAIATAQADLDWFWKIREDVHVFVSQCKFDQHFDISLPIPLIGDYVASTQSKLNQMEEVDHVFPFGHIADGNIHFVVGKSNNSLALTNRINEIIYEPLKSIGGSVSAEHGIGLDKKRYLSYCRTPEEISLMKTLKSTLDPKNILNRGKVLDFDPH